MTRHAHCRRTILACFLAIAPALSAQTPTAKPAERRPLTAEQWRQDLRFMMARLSQVHKNLYHATSAATFDSAAAALDARIPTLARDEIILGFMRIVALAGDGHTNIYPTRDRVIGFHSLPVALYLFSDGLFIRAAERGQAALVGARVTRIGDATAEQAYERVRPYIGRDNEMDARFFAPQLLAMPEVLHALGLAPNADSARFEVESNGARQSVWLRAREPLPPRPGDTDNSWRRRSGWVDMRDGATAAEPLWLRVAPDSVLWWLTEVPGSRAGYAQINQVQNSDSASFEEFSEQLLAFVDSAAIDRLVLDLRLNRGGNGELLKPLVRGLLRRPKVNAPGKLFVLMGRSTFSAAQFLLDDLQEFSEATFVGEPSGSKGNSYGDSRKIMLPNSGITVRASVYYWQDWSPFDTRQWTAPDIATELSAAAYSANEDPALAAVLAFTQAKPLVDELRDALSAGDTAAVRARFSAWMAEPEHAYVDGHALLDRVALRFYNSRDYQRAAWAFAIAEDSYPAVPRSHENAAALYQLIGRPDLERKSLEQLLRLSPTDAAAIARLKVLTAGSSHR
jgi:hypothetical protein